MKRLGLFMLAATMVVVAGCDDDNPVSPTGQPLVFTARLSPANEVPAISNAEANGDGAVQITIDVARDSSGAVTGGTATFYFQLSGFPPSTTPVAAHIHNAAAGVNGAIVVDTGLVPATGLSLADGVATFERSGIPVSAAILNGLIANPAAFYFNVHSTLNPGGFTRGQLSRTL